MEFARTVRFRIRDGKRDEFTRTFENEVLPMLRKQQGFQDELTLIHPERCLGISLWNDENSAKRYGDSTYPKVLEKLKPFIEGTPNVETYQVALSTVSA
jgi:quinol monooxygenase YgiN